MSPQRECHSDRASHARCRSPLSLLRRWLTLVLAALLPGAALAQSSEGGAIAGRVSNSFGRGGSIPGAVVSVRGTTLGGTSDAQGSFQIQNIPAGVHAIFVSKPGFERMTIVDIRVAVGQVTKADAALSPVVQELEPFEVISDPPAENQITALLADRQDASAVTDAIGSEFISRAGAANAAEAMSKVTGASVVGGKYVVIRGLGDRYSNTMLNGSGVPSPDPDRKSVQMDIFPASAIDSIVISKTFTPDQPGSFSGGSVNIKTKSFPEEFFSNASVGLSYNTQTTGTDDFLTTPGDGKWDWAGFDDGTRSIPDEWAGPNYVILPNPNTGQRPLLDQATGRGAAAMAAGEELAALGQAFFPKLTPDRRRAPANHNFSVSIGDSTNLTENVTFGYLAGVSYDRDFKNYDDGFRRQFRNNAGTLQADLDVVEAKSTEEVSWGSLVNLGLKFYDRHEITFNFLYNRNSEDTAVTQLGSLDNVAGRVFENYALAFIEREIQSFQLAGKHELPWKYEAQTDWSVSYATTSQNEPDRRFFALDRNPVTGAASIDLSSYTAPTRFFRELNENNLNLKIDQSIPFEQWNGLDSELKFGVNRSLSKRDYKERRFTYGSNNDFAHLGDPDLFIIDSAFEPQPPPNRFGGFRYNVYAFEEPFNNYTGELTVDAGYGMFDLALTERLNFIGGVRAEASTLSLDANGAAVSSPGAQGSTSKSNLDILPGASFVYAMRTNVNLRVAYGQTLARPTFREISPVPTFDFIGGDILQGNSALEQTSIQNYDIRWEWFPRPGEVLAGGFFYKTLKMPIEKEEISANHEVTYNNREKATVFGFEAELRKDLDFIDSSLSNFNFGANFSYIRSEVDTTRFEFDKHARGINTRPLQGQSPYIINLDLTYRHPDLGTTASVFFNIYGERLEKTSRIAPSVFEASFASLDFRLSQRLTEKWTVKLSAKNLLDPSVERTQDQPDGSGVGTVSSYRKGRSIGIAFSYDF